jgi:hypothetical protein
VGKACSVFDIHFVLSSFGSLLNFSSGWEFIPMNIGATTPPKANTLIPSSGYRFHPAAFPGFVC